MNVVTLPKQGVQKHPKGRSKVTNGNSLGEMDGRSRWARRLRDLIAAYSDDVNPDHSRIPHSTRSIIRMAATLTVELEQAEVAFAQAGKAHPDALRDYQTTANTLRRLIEGLPLKVSVKEAQDVERQIEKQRFMDSYLERMPLADRAVCVGEKEARLDFLKAIAILIHKAINGEPSDPLIIEMVNQLRTDQASSDDESIL